MNFNTINQWTYYAEQCMYEIEGALASASLPEDDMQVFDAVKDVVADAIWSKTRTWDKKNVHFDDVFLCIDDCSFKAEGQDGMTAAPAEMQYPDMSNVDKSLAAIGLQLVVDWDAGVEYTEDLDEYGSYSSFVGDIKAAVKLINSSKFIHFAKSVHGIVDESAMMNESMIGIDINVKQLLYKELSPMSQAINCQLLLLDKSTYASYNNNLERKMQMFGVPADEYRELRDAIDEYGCVAMLKSKSATSSKVFASFAPVGLQKEDLHELHANGIHIWWFAVRVHNVDET